MDREQAARVLGIPAGADPVEVRAAYRRLLRRTHPDVSGDADATDRTVLLTEAFTVLTTTPPAPAPPTGTGPDAGGRRSGRRSGRHRPGPPPDAPPPPPPPVEAAQVDAGTIAVGAPPDETLLLVLDVAHHLGDISYLDPSAGLVEVVVEFVEAPTSSVLLTLQGRATGVTDVFCTVEPLSGGEAPPADAVTRLVLATMAELRPAPGNVTPDGGGGA